MIDEYILSKEDEIMEDFYGVSLMQILDEYHYAIEEFPDCPDNIYEMYTILAEECGEVAKALLDMKHKDGSIDDCMKETAQTAAMCIRLLEQLNEMKEGE